MNAEAKKDFADENGLVLLSPDMLTYCSSQYYISQFDEGSAILNLADHIKCYGCYGGSWEGLNVMLQMTDSESYPMASGISTISKYGDTNVLSFDQQRIKC